MNVFLTIPFFRILIPFVAGILLGIRYNIPAFSWIYFAVLVLLISIIIFYKAGTRAFKELLLILMDVFLFMDGVSLVSHANKSQGEKFYGNKISPDSALNFIAFIDDLPLEKEKTFKLSLQLLAIKPGLSYQETSGNITAYLRKSNAARLLKAGDVLLIRSKIQEPQDPKNPFEFNYRAYLANKQIYHTTFIDSNAYHILPAGGYLNPVWKSGLVCKDYILKQLKNSKLTTNSYAICAALLTGYDDEIDKSVMDAFSHSGTLHVLSVSGLHTGLIYLVLGFLFDLADKRKKHKLLKFIFITLVLWLFALITGFSSPVLRAVLMFNLLGLGKIYFRHDTRNQMNILLVSAFILLSYNPFFITDVGFQLSYFALAGLIFFQPKLSAAWQPSDHLVNLIWQSITASVAATISTLPLTLLYFKQFPLWFFICNLVVVPATFVILLLAVLVVLHLDFAAIVINYLIKFLIFFIELFNSGSYGFIDMINFNTPDALLLSALIVLISLTLQYRSYKLATLSMSLLIFWQVYSVLDSFRIKQKELFTTYHIKNKNIFSVKNKARVFLNDNEPLNYNHHVKPHFISFNNPEIINRNFNYIENENHSVLILYRPGFWPSTGLNKVNTIILLNNFTVTAEDLRQLPALKIIVSGSSNNTYTSKKTEELSRKFGLGFFNTNHNGAYLLAFN